MTDKVQITPMVTTEMRDLLRRTCQEKGCSQGDLVEQGLMALLCPSAEGAIFTLMLEQLEQLTDRQRHMHAILERLLSAFDALTPVETPGTPPPAPGDTPPIATYEQMYGPIEAPVAPEVASPVSPPPPPRPGLLRRWLMREVLS